MSRRGSAERIEEIRLTSDSTANQRTMQRIDHSRVTPGQLGVKVERASKRAAEVDIRAVERQSHSVLVDRYADGTITSQELNTLVQLSNPGIAERLLSHRPPEAVRSDQLPRQATIFGK